VTTTKWTFTAVLKALVNLLRYRAVGDGITSEQALDQKTLKVPRCTFPEFATFDKNNLRLLVRWFPWLLNLLLPECSLRDKRCLSGYRVFQVVERISLYPNQLKVPALVEELRRREFYVGIIGNDPAEALPLMGTGFLVNYPVNSLGYTGMKLNLKREAPSTCGKCRCATEMGAGNPARIVWIPGGGVCFENTGLCQSGRQTYRRWGADGLLSQCNPYLERTSAFALADCRQGWLHHTVIDRRNRMQRQNLHRF